jgi:hypothetical protein
MRFTLVWKRGRQEFSRFLFVRGCLPVLVQDILFQNVKDFLFLFLFAAKTGTKAREFQILRM